MKNFHKLGLAAGFLFWLASSPASADLAAPDAGSEGAAAPAVLAAMQTLAAVLDGAGTVSETSTLVSDTRSIGPASAPFTSQGVDSSRGPLSTGTGSRLSLLPSSGGSGELRSAAAPASAPAGGGEAVAASPPALDLPTLAVSSAPSSLATAEVVEELPPAVPIPASLLLLGGGVLGILPLRRFARPAALECRG